jgi:hypothetical protein
VAVKKKLLRGKKHLELGKMVFLGFIMLLRRVLKVLECLGDDSEL